MSRLADHLAFKECQIFKSEIPSGGTSAVSLWSQSLSEPTFLSSGDAVAWLLMEWGGVCSIGPGIASEAAGA